MFCAVMLICIPGIQITVFAVGQYTANKMVTLTKQFLQRHPEGRALLSGRQSAESIVLQGPGGYLDKRIMEARPSQSTVARRAETGPTRAIQTDEIYIFYSLNPGPRPNTHTRTHARTHTPTPPPRRCRS